VIKNSINEKLVLSFVLIGTIAIVLVTAVTFYYQKSALLDRTYEQLTSLRHVKKKIVEDYFHERIQDVEKIANSREFDLLKNAFQSGKEADIQQAELGFQSYLSAFVASNTNYSAYTFQLKPRAKQNVDTIFFTESRIDTLDMQYDLFANYRIPMDEKKVLTFSIQFGSDLINKLVYEDNNQIGLGTSGEIYLVGDDYIMRSKSRFFEKKSCVVKNECVQNALNGKEGVADIRDYRNVEVLSSYAPLSIPNLNWVILAEIDYREAMIPIDDSRRKIMFIGIILMTITFLVAFLISKTISAPIVKLKDASIHVGEGNFDVELIKSSNDEIGDLTDTFNRMTAKLKEQNLALHEREERLNHFYKATNDGIVLHDNNETILFNQALSKLSGYSENELYEISIQQLIPDYTVLVSGQQEAMTIESMLNKKNGESIPIEIQQSKIELNGKKVNATVIRDICKRKSVENDLKIERRKRLRAVIDGQDSERQRLSRELHDGLGQSLIATKLKLEAIQESQFEGSEEMIRDIRESFDNTIDEVRRISNNLMPAALEEFGIQAALRLLAEEIGDKKNMHIDFEARGEFLLLTKRARIYLFRIAQEALNNIVKHAQASNVKLSLCQIEQKIELKIEDDGIGFDSKNIQSQTSNGLYNIRERVNLLHGSLEIFSQKGKGSVINVLIPLDNM
jgi:PAS domain S-box-containing protein